MEERIIEDLTLLLLHLTEWEEQVHDDLTIDRARKGFCFEALDARGRGRPPEPEPWGQVGDAHRSRDRTGAGVGSQVSG